MFGEVLLEYPLNNLQTPCYVIDLGLLRKNLELLEEVQVRTGCRILLAQKGYAAWSTYGLCRQYLAGAAASSLHEAKLAHEYFGGELHLCTPAYRDDDMDDYLRIVDHIVFNSFSQWGRFKHTVQAAPKKIACGLRVNPMHSEVKTKIYDPCAPGSRLGIIREFFDAGRLDGITGLHFHTLCELNADSLARTLPAVERQFGDVIRTMDWINFGGGHHITRADYDVDLLCELIIGFYKRYRNIKMIYLEPGEAIALNTGVLVASVLDIMHNALDIAILDASCAAHMPDVLEMPYRPTIISGAGCSGHINGGGQPGEKKHTYRLAGPTCLAGDVIGDYSFDNPLAVGDKLVFGDMAHYTMVKNTMFNGVNLPDIVLYDPDTNECKLQRRFTYDDFKSRLS
ncbi:MAG: carboxynorspermidine decarboxylase [Planctomycetales bacterium]|nr:carboxynorspermidine decarboxylase [Planctomycetales bacterium]